MKQKNSDMVLLLNILLLFSASVGILHGRKKNQTKHDDTSEAITLTTQDTLDYLQPLLYAHSIDTIAQTLKQFTGSVIIAVLRSLFDDVKSPLLGPEKVELLVGTAFYHAHNKKAQHAIFDLLPRYEQLLTDNPVFFIAARGSYASAIPDLVAWLKGRSNGEASKRLLQSWSSQALNQTVNANDVAVIESLYAQGIRLKRQKASSLLWRVVDGNKDVTFVPFLVKRGNADVNYVGKGKRTVLVRAVQNGNKNMVQALLEEGADAKKVADVAVGTADQVAFERGYIAIEELLRLYEGK